MSAEIDFLPVWKKGATPEERLLELAAIARKHPQRFAKFVFAYIEEKPAGGVKVCSFEHGCSIVEAFGLYELAKLWHFEESKFK